MSHNSNAFVNIFKWDGSLKFSRPLEHNHYEYLYAFATTLRVVRSLTEENVKQDYIRNNVGLPLGQDQEFYVGAFTKLTQKNSPSKNSIKDYLEFPKTQPSSWCCWRPDSSDYSQLIITNNNHNLANSYNCFEPWLNYLIKNFIQPWGYSLEGKMKIYKKFDQGKRILSVTDT